MTSFCQETWGPSDAQGSGVGGGGPGRALLSQRERLAFTRALLGPCSEQRNHGVDGGVDRGPSPGQAPAQKAAPKEQRLVWGARGPRVTRPSDGEATGDATPTTAAGASGSGAPGPSPAGSRVLGPGVPGSRGAHGAEVHLRERAALEERRAAVGVRVSSWGTKAKQMTSKQPAAGSH